MHSRICELYAIKLCLLLVLIPVLIQWVQIYEKAPPSGDRCRCLFKAWICFWIGLNSTLDPETSNLTSEWNWMEAAHLARTDLLNRNSHFETSRGSLLQFKKEIRFPVRRHPEARGFTPFLYSKLLYSKNFLYSNLRTHNLKAIPFKNSQVPISFHKF